MSSFDPTRHPSCSFATVATPSLLRSAFPTAVYVVVFGDNRELEATVVSVHRTFPGAMASARNFAEQFAPLEEWNLIPAFVRTFISFLHPQLHQHGFVQRIQMPAGFWDRGEDRHWAFTFDTVRVGAPEAFFSETLYVVVSIGRHFEDNQTAFRIAGVFRTAEEALLRARHEIRASRRHVGTRRLRNGGVRLTFEGTHLVVSEPHVLVD